MSLKRTRRVFLQAFLPMGWLFTGCDFPGDYEGGSIPPKGLVAVVGDFQTDRARNPAPWDVKLAAMLERDLQTFSTGTDRSGAGPAMMQKALAAEPAVVLVYLGAVDVLASADPGSTIAQLTSMLDHAGQAGVPVVLATLPTMVGPRLASAAQVDALNTRIRQLAVNRKTRLAKVGEVVGGAKSQFAADGVTLSDLGATSAATAFANVLK